MTTGRQRRTNSPLPGPLVGSRAHQNPADGGTLVMKQGSARGFVLCWERLVGRGAGGTTNFFWRMGVVQRSSAFFANCGPTGISISAPVLDGNQHKAVLGYKVCIGSGLSCTSRYSSARCEQKRTPHIIFISPLVTRTFPRAPSASPARCPLDAPRRIEPYF